jgi:hypothetical protein
VFLPAGTQPAIGADLRAKGWVTIQDVGAAGDNSAEARRLGCQFLWNGQAAVEL